MFTKKLKLKSLCPGTVPGRHAIEVEEEIEVEIETDKEKEKEKKIKKKEEKNKNKIKNYCVPAIIMLHLLLSIKLCIICSILALKQISQKIFILRSKCNIIIAGTQ